MVAAVVDEVDASSSAWRSAEKSFVAGGDPFKGTTLTPLPFSFVRTLVAMPSPYCFFVVNDGNGLRLDVVDDVSCRRSPAGCPGRWYA